MGSENRSSNPDLNTQGPGGPIRKTNEGFNNSFQGHTSSNYRGTLNNSYNKRISDAAATAGRAVSEINLAKRDIKFMKGEISSIKNFLKQLHPKEWAAFEAQSAGDWSELDEDQRDLLAANWYKSRTEAGMCQQGSSSIIIGEGDYRPKPHNPSTHTNPNTTHQEPAVIPKPSAAISKPPAAILQPAISAESALLKAIEGLSKRSDVMEDVMGQMLSRLGAEKTGPEAINDEEDPEKVGLQS